MKNDDILQFMLNDIYYYLNEQILILLIFEEIHVAKIKFIDSGKEQIVDMGGITKVLVSDVLIPTNILGGEEK